MASHDHGHAHEHGGQQAYLADQLCTIAVTAAYAGVMGFLFYSHVWGESDNRSLLTLVVPWIQYLVVGGSILLFAMAIIRAVGVWWMAGSEGGHAHEHEHDHEHGHDHGHDHSHDHGWSPLRYVPLVLPLVFYFIGLPSSDMIKRFEQDLMSRGAPPEHAGAGDSSIAEIPAVVAALGGTQAGFPDGIAAQVGLQFSAASATSGARDYFEELADDAPAQGADVGLLEQIAKDQDPAKRAHWRQFPRVETEGFFDPGTADGRYFRVVRLRMACCLNDAQPAFVLAASRKPLPIKDFKGDQWVVVQGRLDFIEREGKYYPLLKVYSLKKKPKPANIYLK